MLTGVHPVKSPVSKLPFTMYGDATAVAAGASAKLASVSATDKYFKHGMRFPSPAHSRRIAPRYLPKVGLASWAGEQSTGGRRCLIHGPARFLWQLRTRCAFRNWERAFCREQNGRLFDQLANSAGDRYRTYLRHSFVSYRPNPSLAGTRNRPSASIMVISLCVPEG